MEGKTVWQWLKPLLLILPVLVVTFLALWELVDHNAIRLGATTLNQLSLVDIHDQTEPTHGPTESFLAPKEESFNQLTGFLSNSQNRITSWEKLVALISQTAPSAADFGSSFGSHVYVQLPDTTTNEPAPAANDNSPPAPAPSPESSSGATSTTGNHAGGGSNSGSSNSGSGNGDDCDSSGSGNYCDDDDDDDCDSSGSGNYCDDDD